MYPLGSWVGCFAVSLDGDQRNSGGELLHRVQRLKFCMSCASFEPRISSRWKLNVLDQIPRGLLTCLFRVFLK